MREYELRRIRALSQIIKHAGGSISVVRLDESQELENLLLKREAENELVEKS